MTNPNYQNPLSWVIVLIDAKANDLFSRYFCDEKIILTIKQQHEIVKGSDFLYWYYHPGEAILYAYTNRHLTKLQWKALYHAIRSSNYQSHQM